MKILFRKGLAFFLVFTMIITLGVGVLALDEDMTDEKVELSLEEDIGETINLEDEEAPEEELAPEEEADLEKELAPKEEAVLEEDLDQEDEVDQEELDPEPVDEPEPEPEPEEEEEEPQKKEETEEVKEVESKKTEKTDKAEEIEEEYDSGLMLDGFPATPHPDNPQQIMRFEPGSLGPAIIPQKNSRMGVMTNSSGLDPGEVRTSKTASPVPGMVNTWDIKVRIEGRDHQEVQTTDIVLVIDRSGSMDDIVTTNPNRTRLYYAKQAAKNFIDATIQADSNLRIAIVSFASEYQGAQLVTTNHTFSKDADSLKSAVDGLTALGGTHTQAGIIQGEALLTGSNADNKFMVLLSDGQPTYSYEPSNWEKGNRYWSGGIFGQWRREDNGIYDGNFNTNRIVGDGSNLTQNLSRFWDGEAYVQRRINNGSAAIKAGEDARVGLDGLFTIAVNAGTEGTPILQQIASPGMAYSTSNPGDLQAIYNQIGTQIQTQYAIRNAVITDEMGDGFSLIDGSIATTEGTTEVAPADAGNNETITWTIDPAVTQLVPDTTDVRYAEMTYRVEINDDILELLGAKTEEHKLFETNKFTELEYMNSDDQEITKNITSPKVDPVLLKIKKILKDENGDEVSGDPRTFNVNINKSGPDGFNHDEELVPGADYVWLTTLRYEGNYNVEETSITGSGIINLDEFEIKYNINGEQQRIFEVDHNKEGIPRGDVAIEVTNQLKSQTVDVRIEKEVTGNLGDLEGEFEFTVQVEGEANPRTLNLKHGEHETLSNIPKKASLTLTEQSRGHDVTVMVGEQEIVSNADNEYIIELEGEGITIKVTNHKNEEIDTGITFDTLPYILILAVSTLGLGVGFVRKRNIGKGD